MDCARSDEQALAMKIASLQPAVIVQSSKLPFLFQAGLLVLAYSLLYARLLPDLIKDWSVSTYSYGFLVPIIAGYLAWQKRDRLKKLLVVPSYWGILSLVFAVLLFLIGQIITDSSLMRVSMVLSIAALIQSMLGPHFARCLRFPLFYLALMIPLPYVLVDTIVNYLMFFDARHSASILQLLGIPIYLDSNFLYLPTITLEVADACSGISSIFALIVLAVVYTYFLPLSATSKAFVVACTVPIAVFSNLIRIVMTVGLTYYLGPVVLASPIHKFHATFNFLLSVFLLVALTKLLRQKYQTPAKRNDDLDAPPSAVLTIPSARSSWKVSAISASVMILAIWLSALLEGAPAVALARVDLAAIPTAVPAFNSVAKAWPDAYVDPKAEHAQSRFFATVDRVPIELFLGYRADNSSGERLQSPKLALPERWSYLWVRPDDIKGRYSERINGNWMLTQMQRERRLVFYWYQSSESTFGGEIYYRFALLKERLMNSPGDMFVVRLATPVIENESIESAQERLRSLALIVHDDLTRSIERRK
jgi:EpsI family protein